MQVQVWSITFTSDLVGWPVIPWGCRDHTSPSFLWGACGSSPGVPRVLWGWDTHLVQLLANPPWMWKEKILGIVVRCHCHLPSQPPSLPPSSNLPAWLLEVAFIQTIIWQQLYTGHWDGCFIFKHLMMTAELFITNMIESSLVTSVIRRILKRLSGTCVKLL